MADAQKDTGQMESSDREVDGSGEVKPMSGLQRIWGTLFEPSRTFTWLAQKPTWILPVVILMVIVLVTSVVSRPLQIQEQVLRIEENDQLTDQQKEQYTEMVHQRTEQPVWKILGYVFPIVGVFIFVLLLSAIWYFGANVLLGGNAPFKKMFSLYSHTTLTAIPATIVKVPLMLAKGSLRVQTSLAALMPAGQEDSVIFKLLAKTDIFSIWQHVLLAIGLTVIYKFDMKKAAGLVIAFYCLWIVVSVAFSVLTKGRFMMG
jgi:tryptophan-rich sensory protein